MATLRTCFTILRKRLHRTNIIKKPIYCSITFKPKRSFSADTKTFDGPSGLPVIGNVLDMRNPMPFLTKSIDKYGDSFRMSVGGTKNVVFTIDPYLVEYTMSLQKGSNGQNYS